jgi:phosphohistidine swiveling domain-containing protein
MPAVEAARPDSAEPWDNLNYRSPPNLHWTTDNVGEAAPGVLSPLGASIWTHEGELATREIFVAIGVMPRSELGIPERREDRVNGIFFGRFAQTVELHTMLGDRLPGTSGPALAEAVFGVVPDDIVYEPTVRRYPAVIWKLSRAFLAMPGRLRREPPVFHERWRRSIDSLPSTDAAAARQMLVDGCSFFLEAVTLQSISVVGNAQLMHEALSGVVEEAGVGDVGVLSGTGGAELRVITDIWRASRGELTLDQVIAEHGFHGPLEGEVSSAVWREDRSPLERMIRDYTAREDPRRLEAERRALLPEAQAEVLAALPRSKRAGSKLVLNMAAKRIPLRGLAKRSFLQGLDVIRGSARRIGAHLTEDGVLDDPEDAFYLTRTELLDVPANARELVAKRRERREAYRHVSIPSAWKGTPVAVPTEDPAGAERVERVQGLGVSAGVAEGTARVVTDPSFAEVEPDEVLVAPTTDPSWASIMYVSSALVVDIGGPISHAAVVARELGMPCVVGTRTGTRDIRTGDRVRVDGATGTVEILVPV